MNEKEEIDWLELQFHTLPTMEAGGFFIYGSHHHCILPENKICLKVDTPYAFGSGHHPTTANCLKLIEELAQNNFALKKGLDIGCGSGILSLAMAVLWKKSKIFGCDCEEASVKTSLSNSSLNTITNTEFILSDGINSQLIQNGPYDLITANIHLNTLCKLTPQLPAMLTPHGKVIFSGILDEQKDELIQLNLAYGMHLEKCYVEEGWAALILSNKN